MMSFKTKSPLNISMLNRNFEHKTLEEKKELHITCLSFNNSQNIKRGHHSRFAWQFTQDVCSIPVPLQFYAIFHV